MLGVMNSGSTDKSENASYPAKFTLMTASGTTIFQMNWLQKVNSLRFWPK